MKLRQELLIRTDNDMTKKEVDKRYTTMYKTQYRKLRTKHHDPFKNSGLSHVLQKVELIKPHM